MLTRFTQRLGLWMFACLLIPPGGTPAMADTPNRADEGRVAGIEIYPGPDNKPLNAGTLIGGIAGGVIGHQIGSGRGNTAATIVGALGGAAIGNEIEKKQEQAPRYRITVRLDSGSWLIVYETRDPNLRVGDRVRIEEGRAYRI